MPPKILTAKNTLIEQVAGELAATFYEAGRSSGMTSKYKTPQAYAKKYLERFIPKAVDILLEMMKPTSNCSPQMRAEIYEAMMERINDPELNKYMPNPDIAELAKQIFEKEKKQVVKINTTPKTILHKE